MAHRPLHIIADEIIADWPKAANSGHPAGAYLLPMLSLTDVTDRYYYDDGRTIVMYFLSNATSWRGDNARRIKAELREMIAR